MEEKLKDLKLSDNQKIPLYFGLSKAYEDKKEFLKIQGILIKKFMKKS